MSKKDASVNEIKSYFNCFLIEILNEIFDDGETEEKVKQELNIHNIDNLAKSKSNLQLNIEQFLALLDEKFIEHFIENDLKCLFKLINHNITSFSGNIMKLIEIKLNVLLNYITRGVIEDENCDYIIREINKSKKLCTKINSTMTKTFFEECIILPLTKLSSNETDEKLVERIINLVNDTLELRGFYITNKEEFNSKYLSMPNYKKLLGAIEGENEKVEALKKIEKEFE